MTMEEELRRLTSNSAAKENEETRERSNFRSPVRDWEGDVTDITGPYTVKRGNGNEQTVVRLRVNNLIVTKSTQPYTSDTIEFEMNLPREANVNSEIGQMVKSASAIDNRIDSLLDLKGKHLNCTEKVNKYPGRRNSGNKDASGRDIWVDTEFTTYYYHVNAIGGSIGSNGSAPAAPAEANPAVMAAVLNFANGLTAEQFAAAVLRDVPGAAGDPVIRGKIINRTFLDEAVKNGSLQVAEGIFSSTSAEEAATV